MLAQLVLECSWDKQELRVLGWILYICIEDETERERERKRAKIRFAGFRNWESAVTGFELERSSNEFHGHHLSKPVYYFFFKSEKTIIAGRLYHLYINPPSD